MSEALQKGTSHSNLATCRKADHRAGKYLSFRLAKKEFAINVLRVREIMGVQDLTDAAQAPAYVKGVINLRGKMIPVIDLRVKFGLPEGNYTHRTRIIIVQLGTEARRVLMGGIVDGVSEVLSLQPCDIDDIPDFGNGMGPSAIGMARIKGKVKVLLDTDLVLTAQELDGLETLLN